MQSQKMENGDVRHRMRESGQRQLPGTTGGLWFALQSSLRGKLVCASRIRG